MKEHEISKRKWPYVALDCWAEAAVICGDRAVIHAHPKELVAYCFVLSQLHLLFIASCLLLS